MRECIPISPGDISTLVAVLANEIAQRPQSEGQTAFWWMSMIARTLERAVGASMHTTMDGIDLGNMVDTIPDSIIRLVSTIVDEEMSRKAQKSKGVATEEH